MLKIIHDWNIYKKWSEDLCLRLCHLNHVPRDDQALDLGSSFVDLVDLGVSHQLLDGVITVEAIATKDLGSTNKRIIIHWYPVRVKPTVPEQHQMHTCWQHLQPEPWQWRRSKNCGVLDRLPRRISSRPNERSRLQWPYQQARKQRPRSIVYFFYNIYSRIFS